MKENSQLDFMIYFKQTFSDLLYFKEKYHIDCSVRFIVKLLDIALHIMEIYDNNVHFEFMSPYFIKKTYTTPSNGEYKILDTTHEIIDGVMIDISNIDENLDMIDKLITIKAILVRYFG